MAQFGMQTKSRRKAGISGFHAEYLNNKTHIELRKKTGPNPDHSFRLRSLASAR